MSATLDFNKMTVVQLKEYAKQHGIKLKSQMKKAEIVEVVANHEELVGDEEEGEVEINMDERTTLKMTIPQLKEFAKARDIKIPSGATKKAEMSAYINGYLDELALGSNPTDLGETDLKEEEISAISANLEEYAKYGDRAWLKHLHVHGWTVVPGVFSEVLIGESLNFFWTWLEGCVHEGDVAPINREDPETWSYNAFPCGKGGLIKHYINQECFLWELRRAAKPTFEEIYRDPKTKETEELVCSFDGAIFSLPSKKIPSWFHFDQPRDMDSTVISCVQGIACLTDSQDNDGGFVFMKNEETPIGTFFDEYHERHPSCGIVWGKINMNDEVIANTPIFKVNANAGDLILFDSRLLHCNIPPSENSEVGYRMATYISYQPKDNVDESTEASRKQLFEQGRGTGHWCYGSWFTPQAVHQHTYGAAKVTPPELEQPNYDEVDDLI